MLLVKFLCIWFLFFYFIQERVGEVLQCKVSSGERGVKSKVSQLGVEAAETMGPVKNKVPVRRHFSISPPNDLCHLKSDLKTALEIDDPCNGWGTLTSELDYETYKFDCYLTVLDYA